jgi:hypothetical protein
MTTTYRTQADGSAVCPHRDLSVCDACLKSDDRLVEGLGCAYFVPNAAERADLRLTLTEIRDHYDGQHEPYPHEDCPECNIPA